MCPLVRAEPCLDRRMKRVGGRKLCAGRAADLCITEVPEFWPFVERLAGRRGRRDRGYLQAA